MAFNRSIGMLSGDPRYDLGAPTTSMQVGQQLGSMFGRGLNIAAGRDVRSGEQIQKAATGKAVQDALASNDPAQVRAIAGQLASVDATLSLKLLDIAKKMESDKKEADKLNARKSVILNSVQASDLDDKEKKELIELYDTGAINETEVLKRTGFIKQEGKDFTLGEGQVRYDAEGNVIAEGKPKEKEARIVAQPSVSERDVETLNTIIKDNPDLKKAFEENKWWGKDFKDEKVKAKAADIYLEQKTNGGTLADAARRVIGLNNRVKEEGKDTTKPVDDGNYKVGQIKSGYRYKGGGYKDRANWEKV